VTESVRKDVGSTLVVHGALFCRVIDVFRCDTV